MSRPFLMIHNNLNWQTDITDFLLQLPGHPTRFMGEIQVVPKYVFNDTDRQDALAGLIDCLLASAPPDTPPRFLQELSNLKAQLHNRQLWGEMLLIAEQKLMLSFGHKGLPRLLSAPEGMFSLPEPPKIAGKLGWFFKWMVALLVLRWIGLYFHWWPFL